jgi:hypothetical protein
MKISMIIEMTNPQSNGRLIVRELLRQEHEVQVLDMTAPSEQLIMLAKEFQPQVVFGTHTHRTLSKECTQKIKDTSSHPLMVLWYCDGYGPTSYFDAEDFNKVKGIYDLMLVAVKGIVIELEGYAKKVVWTPQYYDPTFFGYFDFYERNDIYDVCFIGNLHVAAPDREKFVEILSKRFKMVAFGAGFSSSPVVGKRSSLVYLSSKMSFDTNKSLPETSLRFSERLYKCMANGCLFLAPPTKGLELLFIPGEHLATYDGTIEGLCEKIDYYSGHDEERKKIAKQGMAEIFEKHTIDIRVKQYIKEIEEML